MSMAHLVQELMLAQHGRTAQEELTQESYDGITDNHVFYERDVEKCKAMIRKQYL